jgi:hypothetical protein
LLGDARFFGEAEVGMPPELMMRQDKDKVMQTQLALFSAMVEKDSPPQKTYAVTSPNSS